MATIPPTELAKSDSLSICSGFPLFPALGSFDAGGVATSSTSGTIFDIKSQNLLVFHLAASAKYEVIFGLCGPAYAIKMEVEGETADRTLELQVSDDEIAAGLTFGLTLEFSFNIVLDVLQMNWVWQGWNSHFEKTWVNLGHWNLHVEIDLLEFISEIIELCIEEMNEEGKTTLQKAKASISKSLMSSWGILDERSDTFAKIGELNAGPTLNLPVDITPLVPGMEVLNTALKVFWSRLSFGPQIGFQMPVKVKMSTVTLDETAYPTTFDKNTGALVGLTTGTDPVNPKSIDVELDHYPGFDLTFGLFLNLNLVKLFNVGYSVTWPILSTLGITVSSGPFVNHLSGDIGSQTAQACPACGEDTSTAGLFDVIFEPPEVAAIGS